MLGTVRALIAVHEGLLASDTHLRAGRTGHAIDSLATADALLRAIPHPKREGIDTVGEGPGDSSRLLSSLADAVSRRWTALRAASRAGFADCVSVQDGELGRRGDTSHLLRVLRWCAACGVLADCVAALAREVATSLLAPLLSVRLQSTSALRLSMSAEGWPRLLVVHGDPETRSTLADPVLSAELRAGRWEWEGLAEPTAEPAAEAGERDVFFDLAPPGSTRAAAHSRGVVATLAVAATTLADFVVTHLFPLPPGVTGGEDGAEGDSDAAAGGILADAPVNRIVVATRCLLGTCLWFGKEFTGTLNPPGLAAVSAAPPAAIPGQAVPSSLLSVFGLDDAASADRATFTLSMALYSAGALGAVQLSHNRCSVDDESYLQQQPKPAALAPRSLLSFDGNEETTCDTSETDDVRTSLLIWRHGIVRLLASAMLEGVPAVPSAFPAYVTAALSPSARLEAHMHERGLLPHTPASFLLAGDRLATLRDTVEAHFASLLRCRVLEAARAIILGGPRPADFPASSSSSSSSLPSSPSSSTPSSAAVGAEDAPSSLSRVAGVGGGGGYGSCVSIVVDDTFVRLRLGLAAQHTALNRAEDFHPHPTIPLCAVSAVALDLLTLSARVARAATAPGTPLHTARVLTSSALSDVTRLFTLLVPFRFHGMLTSVPRAPMLLHNDCFALACGGAWVREEAASRLATLQQLPASPSPPSHTGCEGRAGAPLVGAVAAAPITSPSHWDALAPLRALAQEALVGELRRQRGVLTGAMELPAAPPLEAAGSGVRWSEQAGTLAVGVGAGGGGGEGNDDADDVGSGHTAGVGAAAPSTSSRAEGGEHMDVDAALVLCVRRQMHALRSASVAWSDCLPRPLYRRAVGHLGDAILQRTCAVVVGMTSISEPV